MKRATGFQLCEHVLVTDMGEETLLCDPGTQRVHLLGSPYSHRLKHLLANPEDAPEQSDYDMLLDLREKGLTNWASDPARLPRRAFLSKSAAAVATPILTTLLVPTPMM